MAKAKPSKLKCSPPKSSSTLAAFKAVHDPAVIIPTKIRAALARLAKEEVAFAYEQTGNSVSPEPMTKRADVSTAQLSQYRKQFAEHIVKVPGITGTRRPSRLVWFGDSAVAFAARDDKAVNLDDLE
jgi:hypothetical protein